MLDKIKEELKIKNNINNVKEDIKKLWKLLNLSTFGFGAENNQNFLLSAAESSAEQG